MTPAKRRRAVNWVREQMEVSERRVCRVVGQARSTQRQEVKISEEESRLRERIIALACEYARYGYRRITGLLHNEGWRVNHKRVDEDMAPGGAESVQETAKTQEAVAERWFLYPSST